MSNVEPAGRITIRSSRRPARAPSPLAREPALSDRESARTVGPVSGVAFSACEHTVARTHVSCSAVRPASGSLGEIGIERRLQRRRFRLPWRWSQALLRRRLQPGTPSRRRSAPRSPAARTRRAHPPSGRKDHRGDGDGDEVTPACGRPPRGRLTVGRKDVIGRAVWPDSTRTLRVVSPSRSCQAVICRSPAGIAGSSKRPSSPGTANQGWLKTMTVALMCEWISQNTLTTPGRSNRTRLVSPRGYRPRLKFLTREREKTLW